MTKSSGGDFYEHWLENMVTANAAVYERNAWELGHGIRKQRLSEDGSSTETYYENGTKEERQRLIEARDRADSYREAYSFALETYRKWKVEGL